jgi:hypothetical protein
MLATDENQMHTDKMNAMQDKRAHSMLSIFAFAMAIAFLAIVAFVQLDFENGRDWPICIICHDNGWLLGLLPILLAGFGLVGRGKHTLNGLAIAITIVAFCWWSMPILWR